MLKHYWSTIIRSNDDAEQTDEHLEKKMKSIALEEFLIHTHSFILIIKKMNKSNWFMKEDHAFFNIITMSDDDDF